jgi:rhodanese-related sulfurtransferase
MFRQVLFVLVCLFAWTGLVAQPEISADRLKKKMESTSGYVLLDVRTPEEVREERIEGAENIDVKADDFASRIATLDKDKTYYVYCGSGVRSGQASRIMIDSGFTSVYSLTGGIKAWKQKKLPVKKGK